MSAIAPAGVVTRVRQDRSSVDEAAGGDEVDDGRRRRGDRHGDGGGSDEGEREAVE